MKTEGGGASMPMYRPFKQVDADGSASYFCVKCDRYKQESEFYCCSITVSRFHATPRPVLGDKNMR